MKILCTDLEGTLAPEIWKEISKEFNIPDLNFSTREIKDFNKLMETRLNSLRNAKIKYSTIRQFVQTIEVFEGAKDFLNSLKDHYQIVVVSDTFYQLCEGVIEKLGSPLILCHELDVVENYIHSYKLRQEYPKKAVVEAFHSLNFKCYSIGDSYNDIQMIEESGGALIFAPEEVKKEYPNIPSFENYNDLRQHLVNE